MHGHKEYMLPLVTMFKVIFNTVNTSTVCYLAMTVIMTLRINATERTIEALNKKSSAPRLL